MPRKPITEEQERHRLWLAPFFDGIDALTDDLVGEAARLLADVQNAQYVLWKALRGQVIEAVEQLQRCDARWDDFKRRHGLTVKPPLRSPKGSR